MTNTELIDALNRLDQLFSDESKWTQGVYARDTLGQQVNEMSGRASCFCLVGGCWRVASEHTVRFVDPVVRELHEQLGGMSVLFWNDFPSRKFADVKRLIADTRARLEAA